METPFEPLAETVLQGPTPEVARRLLGMFLVHEGPRGSRGGSTVGRIVETEAYLADGDAASHSARGKTARCASMFLPAGHAYVYLIYGMHLCFNVVTAAEGVGEAVLIRALEPVQGVELMVSRRGRPAGRGLCDGPGKLCQAMGIEFAHDGCELARGPLRLAQPVAGSTPLERVEVTPRIGITKSAELPLRFRTRSSAGRAT